MAVKWKNKPTIKDLKRDYKSAKSSSDTAKSRIEKYIALYKESQTDTKRYRSRLIRKQLEWIIPNIEEPVLATKAMFNLSPVTSAAIDKVKKNQRILDYQWHNQIDKTRFVNKAARKFAIEGTAIVKVGWSTKTKTITEKIVESVCTSDISEVNKVLDKAKRTDSNLYNKLLKTYQETGSIPVGQAEVEIEREVVIENKPVYTVKDNRQIIVDPSAKGVLNDVRFVIDVYETDYATLKQNEDIYMNLDYVKNYIIEQGESDTTSEYEVATDDYDDDDFVFSDLARKKVTIYEYWGYWDINGDGTLEPIVAAWIGNKIIRMEENPFPHKKIPYAFASFMPIDDEIWGEPISELLEDDQKSLTGVVRAMEDITSDNATGQEFVDVTLFDTPVQKKNYEEGKRVYTRKGVDPRQAIYRKTVEPVPPVLFDMKAMYSDEAIKLTGVQEVQMKASKQYGGSTGEPVQRDAESNRDMSILRRFTAMLEDIAKMTISMNKEFIVEDQVMKTGSEYHEVGDISDLSDDFDIKVDIATPQVNDRKARRIMTMMQTNAANMSPEIAAAHYIKTANLWGETDLSDMIESILSTPPSEAEQRMQQIQLELAEIELRAKRVEMLSKVKEMELKDAKIDEIVKSIEAGSQDAKALRDKAHAELNLAQAEKFDSQKKLFDQEFNLIDTGTKRTWEKEDKEFQHLANLEREEVRTKREQENIKLKDDKKEKSSKEENLNYIKRGTLNNESYDAADDVFRNILDKNSLDTSEYTDTKNKKDI
jgi:hypothetical protein